MAKKQSKGSKTALERQDDPKAKLDSAAFLAATRPVLKALQADLLARADGSASIVAALRARWAAETAAHRTADVFEVWRRNLVAQVAAAWVLSVVFVRTLEDRGLLDRNRIAGPGALDSQQQFLQLAPYLSERDYLLEVFRELTRIPAAAAMFDARHSLVWLLAPSAEGAKTLLALFRAPEADAPGFRFGQSDTRFLGDLYQDLDEDVRARYALLQTPHFIESFILDRTLERSVEEFGLDATTMIDPTCGSGHFLLGAFERLFEHRMSKTPGLDPREAVRLALEAVHGVDINPYSIAIARVRLTLAALEKGNYAKLKTAPVLPLNLVVADSLLHRVGEGQASFGDARGQSARAWKGEAFALEEEDAAKSILARRFAVVVGNPPYIVPKDSALRKKYAEEYSTCFMNYALAVPFTQRFFELGRSGALIGLINSNSFMKREFGKKLITEYLPTVNLEVIVNTSGAFIPGHGTPTVILVGRTQPPSGAAVVGVLAKRGEPSTPADAEKGVVWRSIADHWNEIGFENEYVSVAQLGREALGRHPWSLGGGGASELKDLLESKAAQRLSDVVDDIGFAVIIGEDDAFTLPRHSPGRWLDIPTRRLVIGEDIRDWAEMSAVEVIFPFDEDLAVRVTSATNRHLWPLRIVLENRVVSGSTTMKQSGRVWCDLRRLSRDKFRNPLSIAFAFVATHNHFVLDRGGKVFNRSAPIIKLPDGATEDDHLALLGYLNSSTACFWMKQVFFDKGNRGEGGGTTAEAWEKFFEFDGTKLRQVPLPVLDELSRAEAARKSAEISTLAELRTRSVECAQLFDRAASPEALRVGLAEKLAELERLEGLIRSAHEELDWWWYERWGLSPALSSPAVSRPAGARASDTKFARAVVGGEVGRRYFQLCRLPEPEVVASDAWVEQWGLRARLDAIDASDTLALLESPVYKRTFREGFRSLDVRAAAVEWLLSRAEHVLQRNSTVAPLTALRNELLTDRAISAVASEVFGDPSLRRDLDDIVCAGAVPFVAPLRYGDSGLEKRATWERTWELQRAEDAGHTATNIEVPAKYDPKDYRDPGVWRLRGKLDVPKERFISYPGCESDQDKSPVYGWAGWNHLQQAQALAALYLNRKNEEGWKADRLVPMLAGILELVPWVKQWHNEPNADFGGERLGDYFARFVDDECRALAVSQDDLRAWRPAAKGRKATAKASPASDDGEGTEAPVSKPKKPRKAKKQPEPPVDGEESAP